MNRWAAAAVLALVVASCSSSTHTTEGYDAIEITTRCSVDQQACRVRVAARLERVLGPDSGVGFQSVSCQGALPDGATSPMVATSKIPTWEAIATIRRDPAVASADVVTLPEHCPNYP